MKVYRISASARPLKGGFPHYSPLVMASGGAGPMFTGRPYGQKWKQPLLQISMPLLPHPDFFNFGVGAFVCNQRAFVSAAEPLEMSTELLPVSIKGESGIFHIVNVTNAIAAIDAARSVWQDGYPSRDGLVKLLVRPAFTPQMLGEVSLFKIPEDGAINVYCIERTSDPGDGEFKAIVEHEGLTGIQFELIWTYD